MTSLADILLKKIPKLYYQTKVGKLKWLKISSNFFTHKLHSKLPIEEIAIWMPYETPEEGIQLNVIDTNNRTVFNKGVSVLFGTYEKSPYGSVQMEYRQVTKEQMDKISDMYRVIEKKAKTTEDYLRMI